MIPHCIMWILWRERNSRTFEGCERTIQDLKSFSFTHSWNGFQLRVFYLVPLCCICLITVPFLCNIDSSAVYICVHRICPFLLLMNFYLSKKEKSGYWILILLCNIIYTYGSSKIRWLWGCFLAYDCDEIWENSFLQIEKTLITRILMHNCTCRISISFCATLC